MEFQRPHYCLLLALFGLLSYSQAYKFYAGGRDGWGLNPSEGYNHWAGRNRFQVNDTIVFKYKKGSNSVLVVNRDDYDKCNTKNPIKKFEDGDTEFKFDRSGPFFFISGDYGNCEKGQKLIVVVLAVRGPKPQHPPPPSVSPSPVSHPPVAQPPSPVGIPPAVSPYPPSPAPGTSPPSPSPGSSPPATSPAPASAPSYPTPASAPAPATTSPTLSPSATAPPSPPATTPSPAPSSSSTPGSSQTPSVSPGGSANPSSSNETAPSPPNGGSAAWTVAPPSLFVYSVTVVLGAALSGILGAQ